MVDRASEIALVMEGRVRTRRKPWTVVQAASPFEMYRLIHEQLFGPSRRTHFPGRTQSTTDLIRYYAAIAPIPHPGLGKRFRRYLNRFNPWKSPRPTLREKQRLEEEARQRILMKEQLAAAQEMAAEVVEDDEDDEIGYNKALLTTRILELEEEIEIYNAENERIAEIRENLEREQSELDKSRRAFELIRDKTFEIIDEKKDSVRRDREHVRLVALELGKALDKKNAEDQTEEIKELRQKVTELKADLRRRTKRWKKTSDMLQQTIEQLRNENDDLKKALKSDPDEESNYPSTSKPSTA